jgi:hypothetical protein
MRKGAGQSVHGHESETGKGKEIRATKKKKEKHWGIRGIEPQTLRTQSANHTTRPHPSKNKKNPQKRNQKSGLINCTSILNTGVRARERSADLRSNENVHTQSLHTVNQSLNKRFLNERGNEPTATRQPTNLLHPSYLYSFLNILVCSTALKLL